MATSVKRSKPAAGSAATGRNADEQRQIHERGINMEPSMAAVAIQAMGKSCKPAQGQTIQPQILLAGALQV